MSNFIDRFESVVRRVGLSWYPAHTVVHDGETSHEWSKGRHSLAVFEHSAIIELTRIWGHRIHHDMETVHDPSDEELIAAWMWLKDG